MLRPRIIPCLLIHKGGLVKTRGFSDPKYVGDPINAVKIFNEKEADELIVLDIDASRNNTAPNYPLIAKLAAECRMPLCYGGGVRTADQASRIIDMGVEKVSMSSAALANPELLTRTAEAVGRQSVVVVIDVRKRAGIFSRGYEIRTLNGEKVHPGDPVTVARTMVQAGAGEIVLNSIDRDGSMEGYDIPLVKEVRRAVNVPLTVLGGAGSLQHMAEVVRECGVVGLAAGSMFVFKGKYRAVLISYPTFAEKEELFSNVHG